jgi:hypothetical protein
MKKLRSTFVEFFTYLLDDAAFRYLLDDMQRQASGVAMDHGILRWVAGVYKLFLIGFLDWLGGLQP